MKPFAKGFGLLATAFLLSASPAAAEEPGEALVPPENSAVTQYTEAFPTAGGEKDAHKARNANRSARKVLGERNARKLRQRGAEGRAVAEVVVETAPVVEERGPGPVEGSAEATGGGGANGRGGGGAGGSGPEADRPPTRGDGSAATADPLSRPVEASGSSGLTEVIARATGSSSSGGMGILLPLLIVATLLWACAYFARQRRPVG